MNRLAVGALMALFALTGTAAGQNNEENENVEQVAEDRNRWERDLTARLTASQASYSNWVEGGINTLAFSTGLDGKFGRTDGLFEQNHDLRFTFGMVKQDSLALRKAEDLIRINTALKYRGDGFFALFSPTLAATLRTQFAPGFNYDRDPLQLGRPLPVKVSAFFAPATLTQTVGLTYDPVKWFTHRFGVGGKQVVVAIEELRPIYNVPVYQVARYEVGLESRTQVDRELMENVRLRSSLGLFAALNRPDTPDMIWENYLTMRVNSWLVVSAEISTLYDRDISPRVQMKESVALGISVNLL
jgi:hypothetical protein